MRAPDKIDLNLSERRKINFINKGFLPTHLIQQSTDTLVQWVNLSEEIPLEPFFERTVIKAITLHRSPFFYSSLDALTRTNERTASLPKGMIFHMSRCGSTLLTNMFNKLEGTWAFGEPELLDEVFSIHNGENDQEVMNLLRTVLQIYSHQTAKKKNCVVKFPSYVTFTLPGIVKALPEIPRLFLYRDPVEVLASNLKSPEQYWIYMTELVGMDRESITEQNTPLINCALALKETCEFFVRHFDQNSMVINYSQICDPDTAPTVWNSILTKFNIEATSKDIAKSLAELKVYSKNQNEMFSSDSKKKKDNASAAVHAAAEKYLMPVYKKLESLNVIG